jgi:uncharacterized OsmC-like protein
VGEVDLTIELKAREVEREEVRRCLPLCEDFCTVAQSIRDRVDVRVVVRMGSTESRFQCSGLNQG